MSDYLFDKCGIFSYRDMLPGEKIIVWTSASAQGNDLTYKYIFEKVDKTMKLIFEESIVPDDLKDYMYSNRNRQEVIEGRDINMANMAVYHFPGVPNLSLKKPMVLFAKEIDDRSCIGELYTTAYIQKIEIDVVRAA